MVASRAPSQSRPIPSDSDSRDGRARWIPPCRLRAWTRCVRGPGDPPRTSRQAPPSGLRGPSGRTRSAVFGNPFASPVSRADNPGALKLLPLIITSLAEGLVTCRNSGVGAVPRVAASAADDLASDFESRCSAHVAAEVGLSIHRGLRRRLGLFHSTAHRTIEAKKSHLLARGGSEILEDHHGRVPTGGSGDAPSWMRAAPAEVQSGDRGPIRRPTGERPEGEELVRGHVDLIDASAGQTPFPFHVEGRENLSPLNRMSEIRSERGEGLEDRVADLLLPIVPGPGPQPVRRVL